LIIILIHEWHIFWPRTPMFSNYLLVAWRNLRKHRLNTVVILLGLSVAFACSILLLLMVHHEFSYDAFHRNGSSLFEVYGLGHAPDGDEKTTSMSYPVAPTLKSQVPGILRTTGWLEAGVGIRYKNKQIDKETKLVDNDFFSMFSFPVRSGKKLDPLSSTSNVVLSQSTAEAVFGKEDPLGKVVKVNVNGDWRDLIVSAVLENAPENSSIRYDILARMEINGDYARLKDAWNSQNHIVFVQTAPGYSQQQVENGLRNIVKKHQVADEDYMKEKGYLKDKNGDRYAWKLEPFASAHFDEALAFGPSISKTYLYILILIALVILTIASFNFINLNVARAFTRAREVGIRKTIGAGKKQIFFQFWAESFLLCCISVILGIVIAAALLRPFNALFTEKLQITELIYPAVTAMVIGGMLTVSFLAGGYPAWLVSRFNPVNVLKGKVSMNRSSGLRSGLITFQFILSCLLICSTIVIYKQFEFLRTAPLGFKQESVISIPVKNQQNARKYIEQLRDRLYNQPQVVSISGSSANIGLGADYGISKWSWGFLYNGKNIETDMLKLDYDFFSTMGIRPIAGREFNRSFPSDTSSSVSNVVITESLAKQLGKNNIVGLSFYADSAKPRWNVIGIVPDIHFYSMYEKAAPFAFLMSSDGSLSYILVKVKTSNPLQAISLVKAAYKEIEPDNTLGPDYLTENTRRWYAKEKRLSSIFFSAAAVAIILSCLGLFAIVSLVLEQRRKEIGVRKVLGASLATITGLLSGDFLKLIALAFAIAVPIGWYFLNHWLQSYAYRAPLSWWIFPVAGLLSIAIAMLTIGFQTLKASRVNPVESLRSE
ncbi:MAG TPA: FtsX-like permease family protein, partial [Puia sp.]